MVINDLKLSFWSLFNHFSFPEIFPLYSDFGGNPLHLVKIKSNSLSTNVVVLPNIRYHTLVFDVFFYFKEGLYKVIFLLSPQLKTL